MRDCCQCVRKEACDGYLSLYVRLFQPALGWGSMEEPGSPPLWSRLNYPTDNGWTVNKMFVHV